MGINKVLIGWELGGGLGHVMRAAALAREFSRRGWQAIVCLRDLNGTVLAEWPEDVCLLQAPLAHKNSRIINPASYGEILHSAGYHDGNQLSALVTAWSHLIELSGARLVVADHAPTLQLAARLHGLPQARIGTGFFAPPPVARTPRFRTWEAVDEARMAHAEAQVLAGVNAIVQACGLEAALSLPGALAPGLDLIASWPELDCYAALRPPGSAVYVGNETVAGKGVRPAWPSNGAKRVAAYLKSGYGAIDAVLAALREHAALVYVADADPVSLQARQGGSMVVSSTPLDLAALAPDCDVFVCHAGAGAAPHFLAAGKPVLLLPEQAEQRVNADTIAACGAGLRLDPDVAARECGAVLRRLLEEPQFTRAAQDLAGAWDGKADAIATAAKAILALA